MSHPLQCQCGKIRGYVETPAMTHPAICYCKDCQAYAHFLGHPESVLDEHGGTKIVPVMSKRFHLERGMESLACMSLTEKGLLRWYAQCCATPIANTPRDMKVAYVGIVHTALARSPQSMEQTFGPVQAHVNTDAAIGSVKPTPLAMFKGMFGIVLSILQGRLGGSYRQNPFFDAARNAPVKPPRVLGKEELAELRKRVGQGHDAIGSGST